MKTKFLAFVLEKIDICKNFRPQLKLKLKIKINYPIKAIRVANEPYVFTMVYTLVAPFLKAKLRDRLKTVSNRYDEIYKLLGRSKSNSQSTLPKTLGGKLNFDEMTKKTTDDIVKFYLEKGKLF